MYIPASFRIDEPTKLAAFIDQHSFATLVTSDGNAPFATHLPLRLLRNEGERGTLVGHLARGNPQWQHFASEREVLAMFQGPHSYISPSWYTVFEAVPTWNYAAVHVYGIPRVIDDRNRIDAVLNDLISVYESGFENPWSPQLSEDYRDKMVKAIVAFEIPIIRMEGKFKLGQNRSSQDMSAVYKALSDSPFGDAQQLAQLMQSEGLVGDAWNTESP
jgi:transcriptional regulator